MTMKTPLATVAQRASTDAGNRSMRAAGRTRWSVDDYNAACQELVRLTPDETPEKRCATRTSILVTARGTVTYSVDTGVWSEARLAAFPSWAMFIRFADLPAEGTVTVQRFA